MTTVSFEELCQKMHELAEIAKAAFEAMAEALQRIARYLSELWRNDIETILGYNSEFSRTHYKKHTFRRPSYSETVFAGGKPYNRRNQHEHDHRRGTYRMGSHQKTAGRAAGKAGRGRANRR